MYAAHVAVAAEECADDTKGQTCYICTQAVHWKTKEGLVRGCACRGTAGLAHVSCLAEQAKILFAEAEENNLDVEVKIERWNRWDTCSLCEQMYHSVVRCALGWACWKTYVGRPEGDGPRCVAMSVLGSGLHDAGHYEDVLSVQEAELAMKRRLGDTEYNILAVQGNIARTYISLGRHEDALRMSRDMYSGFVKLRGEEHEGSLGAACNYASSLFKLERFDEAKSLMHKTIPAARRILGENNDLTLRMRWLYAMTLHRDDDATLDDVREAVETLEETERIARRVFGGAHPLVADFERTLRDARAALRARETLAEAMAATTLGDA
jgi:hypothetical protein